VNPGPDGVTVADIRAARERIGTGVVRTPCALSPALSDLCGCEIWTKNEYEQRTGSFKERGARNALLTLGEAARGKGVIAASAFHGRELGIAVTVVMPTTAPLVKQGRCRSYGARVLLHGRDIAEARDLAARLVEAEGLTYINGFNDAAIIAGAGTVALEVLEEVPAPDAIVVPVGGGGLIAGVAVATRAISPATEIIGVEPDRCASFLAAGREGKPVRISSSPTLADGLAVPEVGGRAFELARRLVDRIETVDEEAISLAILRLVENLRGVVEGAGATPLAAFLAGKLNHLKGKRVVLLLCGGNIDPLVLSRVIGHSLATDGRLIELNARIDDRPGGLATLTRCIAEAGASVQDIQHERVFGDPDVSRVLVRCILEVRGREHGDEVRAALAAGGIEFGFKFIF
jgi:threonine dehydratase